MKKGIRKRYWVLAALLIAVSVVLCIALIWAAVQHSKPEIVPTSVTLKLSTIMLIIMLLFSPIYLAVILIWFIVTKCMDCIAKRNAAAREDDSPT